MLSVDKIRSGDWSLPSLVSKERLLITDLPENKSNFRFTFVVSLIQMTPLHIVAARGDHISIVKYLIRKGADINIKDHKGVNMHVCVSVLMIKNRILNAV